MSKQQKANRIYIDVLASTFSKSERLQTPNELMTWLVSSGIVPENVVNNWLAVYLYGIELNATKTAHKPKGVKWIAETKVLECVPISRRKLQNLLKNKQGGERNGYAYSLRK